MSLQLNAITISEELRKAYLKVKSQAIYSGLNHSVFSHKEEFLIQGEDEEIHVYFDVSARVRKVSDDQSESTIKGK